MLTIGSLFSGIGGLELGLEWAGLGPVVFQCEIDPFCRAVLAKHWPHVTRFEDVTRPREWPTVDLLCGGFPCQDVSCAGKRRGLGGASSGLWYYFAKVVQQIQPRFVIIENVASGGKKWLRPIRHQLHLFGYRTRALGIAASDCGAPHRRSRVFVLAYAVDVRLREQSRRRERQDRQGTTESGYDGTQEFVRNAVQSRCQRHDGKADPRREEPPNGRWWASEPDFCGGLDGFSAWLDESERLAQAHAVLWGYADGAQARPSTVLRFLRETSGTQSIQRSPGGQVGILAAEVLQSFLRQLSRSCDDRGVPGEGSKASEECLRGVRAYEALTCASRGRKTGEHGVGESPDALHALSQLLARYAESAWIAYRRSNAAPALGWESGIDRVIHHRSGGLAGRRRRAQLRSLGNAVVPQCSQIVGEVIRQMIL